MLRGFKTRNELAAVFRLVSLPARDNGEILSEMGISIEDIEATVEDLERRGMLPQAQSAEDLCDLAFAPSRAESLPYPESRFGDGTIGIFYSALDLHTCEKEIEFHTLPDFHELAPASRFYRLIECSYQGTTVDFRGREAEYPDLVSAQKDGYPFCRKLANFAKTRRIDGFFTPSARHPGGTCVPIFERLAIKSCREKASCKLSIDRDQVSWEYS